MRHAIIQFIEGGLLALFGWVSWVRGSAWWRNYRILVMTCVSLVICGLAPVVLEISTDERELAAVSLIMVLVQGVCVWVAMRKEAEHRERILHRIKMMLQDQVRNKLQVAASALAACGCAKAPRVSEDVFQALRDVARSIDDISDSTLARWELHYTVPRRRRLLRDRQTIG